MRWLSARRDQALWAAIVLVVASLHLFAFGNSLVADDAWYARALDAQALPDFLAFRYTHWSGRMPIEATLAVLMGHPWPWRVINGLMWILFCYSAGRVALHRLLVSTAESTALALVLLLLMSPAVLFNATWWMTGSVNYLWPMALGLYGLIAFVDDKPHGNGARLGFVLASGLAMYNEQVALVLLPASALLVVRRGVHQGRHPWDMAHLAFMALNALVLFSAPGSQRRFLFEEALRFPNFSALDALDKVSIGIGLLSTGMLDPGNLLVLVSSLLSAGLVWRSPVRRPVKALLLAMLGYLLFCYASAIPGFLDERVHNKLYVLPTLGGAASAFPRAYALSAWNAFAVAAWVAAASLAFWRSNRTCLLALATLLLGIGSLVAIGFSPTAYASGWRVHFVCQVGVLLVVARMAAEARQAFGSRPATILVTGMTVMAAYRVWSLLSVML